MKKCWVQEAVNLSSDLMVHLYTILLKFLKNVQKVSDCKIVSLSFPFLKKVSWLKPGRDLQILPKHMFVLTSNFAQVNKNSKI